MSRLEGKKNVACKSNLVRAILLCYRCCASIDCSRSFQFDCLKKKEKLSQEVNFPSFSPSLVKMVSRPQAETFPLYRKEEMLYVFPFDFFFFFIRVSFEIVGQVKIATRSSKNSFDIHSRSVLYLLGKRSKTRGYDAWGNRSTRKKTL